MTRKNKWQAIAYADAMAPIKRVVLVKRDNGAGITEYGIRTIWTTGDAEVVGGMLNPAAYELACATAGAKHLRPV